MVELQSFLSWEPNEGHSDNSRPNRNCRGRVLTNQTKYLSNNKITLKEADRAAPLVSTKEIAVAQTGQVLVKANGIFFLYVSTKKL